MDNTAKLRPTPAQVPGPFFVPDAPRRNVLFPRDMDGDRIRISGQVLATDGTVIPHAVVHVWVADPNGVYDNQDADGFPLEDVAVEQLRLRGRLLTDDLGRYKFTCLRPGNYPLVGEAVDMRPGHIHVRVEADGYATLTTQLYFIDDEYNEHDIPREGFFRPELVVHLSPALPTPGTTQRGVFNFVLKAAK